MTDLIQNPFDHWLQSARYSQDSLLQPPQYIDCWHIALARMAIMLNCSRRGSAFAPAMLSWTDEALLAHFRENVDAQKYYVIILEFVARGIKKEAIDPQDIATNFFYGSFSFPKFKKGIRISYNLTEAFLDYSYVSLHAPRRSSAEVYSPSDIGADGLIPSAIMRGCAANYLLRNFWHNYVHVQWQGISASNFHEFRGEARNQSDFQSDNLSNLLLAQSYGLRVEADRIDSNLPDANIVTLLRRNRCNELFTQRAKTRGEDISAADAEWRVRRTISGYLSGWLLAQGLAVAQIEVQLSHSGPARGRKRASGLAVCLNGAWLSVRQSLPSAENPIDRSRFHRDVATYVQTEYRKRLRDEPRFRAFAKELLKVTMRHLGCEQKGTT